MATTVAGIQTKLNMHLGDSTTNSVSAADRLSAISQATQMLMADIGFDHFNASYAFDYFDTVHRYDVSSSVPDLFEPVDLRKGELDHVEQYIRKQPRDIVQDIGRGVDGGSFSVERYDRKTYLLVDIPPLYGATTLHDCDAYDFNGTWEADATSDATSVATDDTLYEMGTGSVSFLADVSQSGNNYATISNSTFSSVDLEDWEDLASLFVRVYLPTVTSFTSVTAYWGSSSTAYWSATATTDYNGNALVAGWNRLKYDWDTATETSTPDASAIDYLRFDFNYEAGYTDQTFRIDDVQMIRPEPLTLIYETYYIGRSNAGSSLLAYTATTDVPWYSGTYDFFDNAIAHGGAAILFREMAQEERAVREEKLYEKEIRNLRQRLPSSHLKESRTFRPKGLNFNRSKVR